MRLCVPVILVCCAALLLVPASSPAADAERPNIIVIMADDMGFSDIGCYGSEISTPNLDQLAAGGIRFTQFYNTGRCCPTRASLLTGLYSHQVGVGHMVGQGRGYPGDLSKNAVTIAEVLRSNNYRTAMAGKWHVTALSKQYQHNWPLQRGFERFYGTIAGAGNYFNPVTLLEGNDHIEPEGDYYYTDAVTQHAVKYMQEFQQGQQPFFLYVAYTAPHWPLHAREEDIAKYRGKFDAGWDELRKQRYERMIKLGLIDKSWPLSPRDKSVPPWEDAKNRDWQLRRMEVYAAMIDRMDRGIGQIVDQLKEAGQFDNTLILFLADNGGCAESLGGGGAGSHVPRTTRDGRPVHLGNNPEIMPGPENTHQSYATPWANVSNTPFRRYKSEVHEGGIATPLIAHWPKAAKSGSIMHQVGHVIDLLPTCLDAAQVQYPQEFAGNSIIPVEGKSLLPVLDVERRTGHAELFWEHEGNRAARRGDWKLVARHGGQWELYDLSVDRSELNDLAQQQPEKVKELSASYDAWARRAGVQPWGAKQGTRKAQRKKAA